MCALCTKQIVFNGHPDAVFNVYVFVVFLMKDADESQIKVQVCVYAFDLLYFNGESLVRKPLRLRRQLLHDNFNEIDGEFMFAKSMVSSNTEEIEEFLDESIKGI